MSPQIESITGAVSMIDPLVSLLVKIITQSSSIPQSNSEKEVSDEVLKQEVSLKLLQQQARVAQELAIAQRIENANDVEIEEFYDSHGEGNLGLKGGKDGVSLGINGSGVRITKRIYKFKGNNGKSMDIYEQKLNDVLSLNNNDIKKD